MDKLDVFRDYIQKIDVLIVDKNPSSRSRLLKIMYDLGCKRNKIHTAGEMAEAQELIATKNIGIVLSDYFIGGGSGFDLFKVVREKFPDKNELSLILVTSNISIFSECTAKQIILIAQMSFTRCSTFKE